MFKFLRENFTLKLISLITSVMIWMYVTADRPNPTITRSFNAAVAIEGVAPADTIVRLKTGTVPVDVTGPKSQVDTIGENDVQAVVDQSTARMGDPRLRIKRYKLPPTAPDVTPVGLGYVSVDVLPKEQKQLRVEASYNNDAPYGRSYAKPQVNPQTATVTGAQDDVQRVSKLIVFVETNGASVSHDYAIKAQDKDGLLVDTVQINPSTAHVELDLTEAPVTRTVVVSVGHRGRAAYPYQITDIVCDPDQVTVTGKPEQLLKLTNIPTVEIPLDGITADTTRDVPLLLPPGIATKNGQTTVRVTVRVRDTTKPSNTP